MHDRQDFEDVTRGFIGRVDQRQIRAADGRVYTTTAAGAEVARQLQRAMP